MREPFTRAGGLHSYVRGLAAGQKELALNPVVVDEVTSKGNYRVAAGTLVEDTSSVVQYHFAHGAFPFLYPVSRGPWKEYKRVFNFHGPWHQEGEVQGNGKFRVAAKKLLESSVYARFSQFIVASDFFGEELSRSFGVKQENITTIYPGIDTSRFAYSPQASMTARQHFNVPEDAFVAVTVRRLEPRMGIEDALMAISDLPDVFLLIAGTGSLSGSLVDMVNALGIQHRVRLLGRISDAELTLAYQAADVSLVPTRDLEGFGMVVLESMACGTPVIASNVGGLPEAMGPFAAEWTVQANSPKELRSKISELNSSSSIRASVRAYAMTRSNKEMASATENVLQRLV